MEACLTPGVLQLAETPALLSLWLDSVILKAFYSLKGWMQLGQTKHGFIYTFELVQGEHAKVWGKYPWSVPLTGTTGFGGMQRSLPTVLAVNNSAF